MWPASLIVLLVVMVAGICSAQEDQRRAQVAAAAADASRRLETDVLAAPVTPQMTVAELAQRTACREALAETLRTADQVGGTRWIDDQTTQVRLEISGDAVARTLITAAELHPKSLPVALDELKKNLITWKDRTFAATGTSTAAAAADQLRPGPSQAAWQSVPDSDRRQAVMAARRNAATRVMDSVSSIEIGPRRHFSDVMGAPAVAQAIEDWLMSRPVTSLEYRDDMEVRLMLAAPPKEFCAALRAALVRSENGVMEIDDAGWKRFCDQVETRMALPVGRAVVAASGTAPAAVTLPLDPPRWVTDAIDSEGVARSNGPLLRTARVAEAAAIDRLRSRVDALSLTPGLSLGQASRQDPHIAAALTRALRRARTYKVEYNDPEPGSVRVKTHLELEEVWRELTFP